MNTKSKNAQARAAQVMRHLDSGLCRDCTGTRVEGDALYCARHRAKHPSSHGGKRVRRAPAADAPLCACGAPAQYRYDQPTPTWPCSSNWIGKVAAQVTYYCAEHAPDRGAVEGQIRRLRTS